MVLRDVRGPHGVERLTPSPHTLIVVDMAAVDGGLVSEWQFAGAYYVIKGRMLGQGTASE